jgi:hypothetical protein
MSKRTRNPAKPAASQTASQEYRKPRADVYTVLLVVALLMLLLGTAALWMTMKEYNNDIKGGPNPVWHRPATGTMFDPPTGIA